jgi:hypothetical protein
MLRAQADASSAAAKAILAEVAAKRAELEASGQLTPAMQAELDAREAQAKLKQIEADKSRMLAQQIDDLARATRDCGTETDRQSSSLDRYTESTDRATESTRKLRDEQQRSSSASGLSIQSNADREQSALDATLSDVETSQGIGKRAARTYDVNMEQEGVRLGLSDSDAKLYAELYANNLVRAQEEYKGRLAMTPLQDGSSSQKTGYDISQLAQRLTLSAVDAAKAQAASSSSTSSGTTTTVNISLNGTKRSIKTDSAGAATLQDLLNALGADAARAA